MAPEKMRTKVKPAASIPVCFSANRQSSELPANATIATDVRIKIRAGFIFSHRDRAVVQSGADVTGVSVNMSDPRNVAHDKKVTQEKEHHADSSGGAKAKKGRGKKKTAAPDQTDADGFKLSHFAP